MELYYPLILDGATGTELQKLGFTGNTCTEAWVLEHPEAICTLQSRYIEAGSRIVYAPTFGANRIKLEESGIVGKTREYNIRLAKISLENAAGRALVAGDIAPTGKFLAPMGDMSFEELYAVYLEQAAALEEAGVDLFVIETTMTVPEARAAILAVKHASKKPVFVTFTCNEQGRTLTGTDVCAALVTLQSMGADAFGLNCSAGPEEMLIQIRRLREYARVPLIVKPNAGMPDVVDGKAIYHCPPEEFVSHIPDFIAAGAAVFGGCCGTEPGHIAALKSALTDFKMTPPAPAHGNMLLPTSEKRVFCLPPETPCGMVLLCNSGLEEQLECYDPEESGLLTIEIKAEEELAFLAGSQYAIDFPLCIRCGDIAILEKALRLFQGRAIYDGPLEKDMLKPLQEKYGLIV